MPILATEMAAMSLPFSHIDSGVRVPRQGLSTYPKTRSLRANNRKENNTIQPGTNQDELLNASDHNVLKYQSQMAQQRDYTPLLTAVKATAEDDAASFHFPGHNRGRVAPSSLTELIGQRPFCYDLNGHPALGNLFASEGPIFEAQKLAAELFGASETRFLVGGTTCGIQAAIMGTCCPGHTLILPQKAIRELEMKGQKPAALFITSPTYQGICSNLREISLMCHLNGIPLIVDEAHGAHFGFHPRLPVPALQQGADIVVQSTHKVLCSLTQSSMLHLSGNIVDRENICKCLRTLQSTSASPLLLASLDAATARLRENPTRFFDNPIHLAKEAKDTIKQIPGISVLDVPSFSLYPAIDPLRVTISFRDLGLSGKEADKFLCEHQRIVPELIGSHFITFVFTPGTCREHVQKLVSGLRHLSSFFRLHKRKKLRAKCADLTAFEDINIQLTPREAFFAKKKKVDVGDSVGKVCGELICPFPPGIPIMIPGEVISERGLDTLLQCKMDGAFISGASDPLLSSMVICDL